MSIFFINISGINEEIYNVITIIIPNYTTIEQLIEIIINKIKEDNLDNPDSFDFKLIAAEESGERDTDFLDLVKTSAAISFGCNYFLLSYIINDKIYAYVYLDSNDKSTDIKCSFALKDPPSKSSFSQLSPRLQLSPLSDSMFEQYLLNNII